MSDPLKPEPGVLIKLGSLAVHIDEFLSPSGHQLDYQAIKTLLADEEVIEWLEKMDSLALVPKKRFGKKVTVDFQ